MINKVYSIFNKNLLIIIFVSCIIIACLSIVAVYSNRIIFTKTDNFEDIKSKSIAISFDKYNLELYYPETKNNKINEQIEFFAKSYINRVKSDSKYYFPENNGEKLHLFMKYKLKRINGNIFSVIFFINYTDNKTIFNYDIATKTYDIQLGKSIEMENFFEKDSNYIIALCEISKQYFTENKNIEEKVSKYFIDDISNSLQNSFDGYAFSYEHLSLYFSSNKISSKYYDVYEVKIPWEEIKFLLKKNIYLS